MGGVGLVHSRIGMVAALWALTVVGPARAQAPGLPVVNAGVARGVTLGGVVGFPNDAAGGGTPFAISGAIGFRRLAVGGFVSSQNSDQFDKRFYAGGANLTVKVAGGPLVPIAVNLQGGFAYSKPTLGTRVSYWRVPVGLGISWTIPRPVVALKPWIAPRLDYQRTGAYGTVNAFSSTDFGLSGGINLGFLNGLGIDVAFDRVFSEGTEKPTTIGVGVTYTIK